MKNNKLKLKKFNIQEIEWIMHVKKLLQMYMYLCSHGDTRAITQILFLFGGSIDIEMSVLKMLELRH
jgi:hypothetical protein